MDTTSGILANLEGKVVAYGKGAERIFGYREEEVLGKSVEIFHPARTRGMLPKLFKEAMEGKFEEDVILVRKDGKEFRARLTVTPARDPSGNITGLVGMTRELGY